jgi:hypothetical protein
MQTIQEPIDLDTKSQLLYELDYNLWLAKTIEQLKAKNYDQVNWQNLIEELESLSKSQRRELRNRLTTLLEHGLKRCYSNYVQDYRGWTETIVRSQSELRDLLADSPSLKQYWSEIFQACYTNALARLRNNPDYQSFKFPDSCPFPETVDQLLQEMFWLQS